MAQVICDEIENTLYDMVDQCSGCPRVEECEDKADHGESRFCLPMIRAAIHGERAWKTAHRQGGKTE